MSIDDRGRHRAGRHAAPKAPRKAPKRVGALFSAASVGSIGVTGASTLASTSQTSEAVIAEPVNENTVTIPITKVTDRHTSSLRAVAASRSDSRQSLEDTAALNQAAASADPTADPTAPIDTTPTVTSTERRALASVTSSTNQIDDVVAQAEQQAQAQAEALLAQQGANASSNAAAAAVTTAVRANGSRVVPVIGKYRLTARFGQHGRLWSKGWHTGLDFQVRSGTTVVAAEDGTIIKAGWAGAYGYRIEIAHAGGYVTAYNHLSKIEKSSGVVRAGEEIAKSGNTGHTTGPHLHLEVTLNGNLINPSSWLWG